MYKSTHSTAEAGTSVLALVVVTAILMILASLMLANMRETKSTIDDKVYDIITIQEETLNNILEVYYE